MTTETRDDQLTDAEIASLCRRFAGLLDEAEYGLSSWHLAVAMMGRQLHTALGDALGEPSAVTRMRKLCEVEGKRIGDPLVPLSQILKALDGEG